MKKPLYFTAAITQNRSNRLHRKEYCKLLLQIIRTALSIGFLFLYVLYFFFSTLETQHHLSPSRYLKVSVLDFILEHLFKNI